MNPFSVMPCESESGTTLIARIAKARSASRTTTSPLRGKSLTPTSPSNEGHPSDQGLLTISQKCVTHVPEQVPPMSLVKTSSRAMTFL
jgi:hypothetical protein